MNTPITDLLENINKEISLCYKHISNADKALKKPDMNWIECAHANLINIEQYIEDLEHLLIERGTDNSPKSVFKTLVDGKMMCVSTHPPKTNSTAIYINPNTAYCSTQPSNGCQIIGYLNE